MSLQQLADGIMDDTRRLTDTTRLLRDLHEYSELKLELENVTNELRATLRTLRVLTGAEIPFKMSGLPKQVESGLRSITGDDGSLIEGPASIAKIPIRDLHGWCQGAERDARSALDNWIDECFPDLDGVSSLARHFEKIDPKTSADIAHVVQSARRTRREWPPTPELLEQIRRVSVRLKEVTDAVASTETTKAFLAALLDGGAFLEDLNDEVRKWARDGGLWPFLRVRLSRDAE